MKTGAIRSTRDWLLSHAVAVGVLWGFAEATVFFVVPDVLMTLVALFSFRRSLRCVVAVLAGGLAGGLLMYLLALWYPEQALGLVNGVPFVNDWMITQVEADYLRHGPLALLVGPLSGIPFKLYASLAPEHLGLGWFMLVSIPARLERFVITWAVAAAIGWFLRRWVISYPGWVMLGHLGYWSAVCLYYWTVVVDG